MQGIRYRGVPGAVFGLLVAVATCASATRAGQDHALTIYSSARPGGVPPELYRPMGGQNYGPGHYPGVPGFAVVRHDRDVELAAGRSSLRFRDVAALIDPTTVRFASLTDPAGTRVMEQNFEFDLVSNEKLLLRYVDEEIVVEHSVGDHVQTTRGKLLSTSGGLILQTPDGGVLSLREYANVRLPELPGGLITRPTLVWDVDARRAGKHRSRVSYQTGGMTWWADYNLVFHPQRDPARGKLDVGAWVSIVNQSGASYPDARLKLIAGDVQRAQAPGQTQLHERNLANLAMAQGAGFAEKAFFEYHLYTLGRPTTLPDNSTKQIELFPAAEGVAAEKILVYYGLAQGRHGFFPNPVTDRDYGTQANEKIDVYLRFENRAGNGLGVPLPAGRIRVSQIDKADGSLEFIGEDVIDHTAKDESILIRLGSAFDVVGARIQTDYRLDAARKTIEEDFEIELHNHKDEAVEILVRENLYRWVNWQIITQSADFEKVDSSTVEFRISVPSNGARKLRYSVRYAWQ